MKLYTKLVFLLALFLFSLGACDDDDATTEGGGKITVAFSSPQQEIFENVSPQRIALVLSAPASRDITATVVVKSEDGVKEGVDYTLLSHQIHIAKGEMGGYVELSVKDNFEIMPDRTVVLELVEVTGASLAQDVLTCKIIIVSNEGYPTLGFAETLQSVAEEEGECQCAVVLTRPRNQAVTFEVEAVNGTAMAGEHFELLQNEFTIPAGDTVAYVPVRIIDDIDVNEDRTFLLQLKNVKEAAWSEVTASVDVTIVNDDRYVYVSFGATELRAVEDTGRIEVPVVLSSPAKKEVKVKLAVDAASTAKADGDYGFPSGLTLTFPAGVTEQMLPVDIKDNDLVDGSRTLIMNIDSVYDAMAAESNTTYTLTILNEDVEFVGLYDQLMGTYDISYTNVSKGEQKKTTCVISGGDDLAEENENYLKRLIITVSGMGNSGEIARIAIDYDVQTGKMSVPMKQAVMVDISPSHWASQPYGHHADNVFFLFDGSVYLDTEKVELEWNKTYTSCSWNIPGENNVIRGVLCPTGTIDRTSWNIYDIAIKNVVISRSN